MRRRSAPTAARSSPPARTRPPGCGTPPAARNCNGSRMRMRCGRRRSAPTAARSSPPADKTARLWDAASGKELQRLTHEMGCRAASFSPDGRTVVTASWDKTARLWDAASGKELQRLTHEDAVYAASFSPDGRTVVTASDDKTARLWDAASGKELQRLTHDGRCVGGVVQPRRPHGRHRQPTRPPGCGTPPAARSCNGSRMTDGVYGGVVQPRRPHDRHRQPGQDRPAVGRRQRQGAATAHA